MNVANRILVFLLVAAISVAGAAQAADATVHGAHAIELCDNGQVTIILVNDNGEPVAPCDCAACPDCAMPLPGILPVNAFKAARTGLPQPARFTHAGGHLSQPQRHLPLPRGPPAGKEMS